MKDKSKDKPKGKLETNKNNLINIIPLIIAAILAIPLSSPNAQAAPENISIIDPPNDPNNDPITSNFQITVRITDPEVQKVQAKIIGQTFVTLSQINSLDWQEIINISGVSSGNYQLTAKYYNSTGAYFYIQQTIPITIQKPDPTPTPFPGPAQYGSILITITDSNNQPITGAKVIPSGNLTDPNGNVFIGTQPLNQYINLSISKPGFNTTYYQTALTSNQTTPIAIVMHMINGDTSQFDVTGYEGMEAGRGVFVLVKDKFTGAKVENAQIIIYDGATVKSSPGVTVNGRLFVSAPADVRQGQYLIEATKRGYEDFTDTFTIFVPRITPTPSPTPTPAPTPTPSPISTPERKYWSDSMQVMTDEEHDKWLSDTNIKNLGINNVTAPARQPQEESNFPWTLVIISILAVGIAYRLKPEWFQWLHKKQEVKEAGAISTDEMVNAINTGSVDDVQPVRETESIICPLCKISIAEVNKNTSREAREQILEEHLINIHEEDLESLQEYKSKSAAQKIKLNDAPEKENIIDLSKPEEIEIPEETTNERNVQELIEELADKRKNNTNGGKKRTRCQYCKKAMNPKHVPAHELKCPENPANQEAVKSEE